MLIVLCCIFFLIEEYSSEEKWNWTTIIDENPHIHQG